MRARVTTLEGTSSRNEQRGDGVLRQAIPTIVLTCVGSQNGRSKGLMRAGAVPPAAPVSPSGCPNHSRCALRALNSTMPPCNQHTLKHAANCCGTHASVWRREERVCGPLPPAAPTTNSPITRPYVPPTPSFCTHSLTLNVSSDPGAFRLDTRKFQNRSKTRFHCSSRLFGPQAREMPAVAPLRRPGECCGTSWVSYRLSGARPLCVPGGQRRARAGRPYGARVGRPGQYML